MELLDAGLLNLAARDAKWDFATVGVGLDICSTPLRFLGIRLVLCNTAKIKVK